MDSRRIVLVLLVVCAMAVAIASAATAFERAVGVCIRNCAQCKKMFGPYFLGEKCADSCIKFKGKLIPDCEDADSIQPFLQALNETDPRFTTDSNLCATNCRHCDQMYADFNVTKCTGYCNDNRWTLKVLPDCTSEVIWVYFPQDAGNDTPLGQWYIMCGLNCVYSKQAFGDYFLLGKCADYCYSQGSTNSTLPDQQSEFIVQFLVPTTTTAASAAPE